MFVSVCFHSSYDLESVYVEGHRGSSLTAVLYQQEVMSWVSVENMEWVYKGTNLTALLDKQRVL